MESALVPKQTVMVVEDDADIRAAIAEVLKDEGYRVACAGNGAEALAKLQEPPLPSLILLDLKMPVMDGYQFHRCLQESAEMRSLPVVVISADGNVRQKAGSLGITGYLQKPVDLSHLLDTVARYCLPQATQ
jgi:two-component system response regulator MprA